MRTTLNKRLHERALGIIDMIETAEKRIKDQYKNSKMYREMGFDQAETRCLDRMKNHRAAIERLEKSYQDTINTINTFKQ